MAKIDMDKILDVLYYNGISQDFFCNVCNKKIGDLNAALDHMMEPEHRNNLNLAMQQQQQQQQKLPPRG
jgi:hypothetical protein